MTHSPLTVYGCFIFLVDDGGSVTHFLLTVHGCFITKNVSFYLSQQLI